MAERGDSLHAVLVNAFSRNHAWRALAAKFAKTERGKRMTPEWCQKIIDDGLSETAAASYFLMAAARSGFSPADIERACQEIIKDADKQEPPNVVEQREEEMEIGTPRQPVDEKRRALVAEAKSAISKNLKAPRRQPMEHLPRRAVVGYSSPLDPPQQPYVIIEKPSSVLVYPSPLPLPRANPDRTSVRSGIGAHFGHQYSTLPLDTPVSDVVPQHMSLDELRTELMGCVRLKELLHTLLRIYHLEQGCWVDAGGEMVSQIDADEFISGNPDKPKLASFLIHTILTLKITVRNTSDALAEVGENTLANRLRGLVGAGPIRVGALNVPLQSVNAGYRMLAPPPPLPPKPVPKQSAADDNLVNVLVKQRTELEHAKLLSEIADLKRKLAEKETEQDTTIETPAPVVSSPAPAAAATVATPVLPDCTICMERPIDAVFLDCFHTAACYECAITFEKKPCPMCRKAVISAKRLFVA